MARKSKTPREEQRSAADYYKLHAKAVDDLVHADESNSPEVSKEELAKYRSRHGVNLADWVKMLLIKFWFNGAVCFFFFWGLGIYVQDLLDQLVVIGIAMGVLTDLMVNNILRFYAKTPGENDRWMMFPKKGYASFPLNILYAFVVLLFVFMLYNLINAAIVGVTGATDSVPLGVEPVLFGLFYLLIDLMFLGLKNLFLRIVEDARHSAR
ncbi:MAG: hypothetical protein IJV64_04300 [Oscillospiraceae bacterium]|nr:hypothetical protein [Oscillospiraceae bacterium]